MGMVIGGRWTEADTTIQNGAYQRAPSAFDRDLAPEVIAAIARQPGRYHLIASLSCPWSHRTLMVRALKGLAAHVPVHIAGGQRLQGYAANGGRPWPVPGTDAQIVHIHELYALGDPSYTGRATVPILWDMQTHRIAGNDSAKIMRGLDSVIAGAGGLDFTLAPGPLLAEIETWNSRIHKGLANAVYRAGLAQRQDAYDDAAAQVFATLDELEDRLSARRYLFGATITETDWRLFATLVRFDVVYATHFRCTRRRLVDYPHLWAYARDLYTWRGIARTVDVDAIRDGYYANDGVHNPHRIVAEAPAINWRTQHGRAALGPAQVVRRDGATLDINPATLTASSR